LAKASLVAVCPADLPTVGWLSKLPGNRSAGWQQ